MPGTGECSASAAGGGCVRPSSRSVRRLWSLRQPASPAARPAVLAGGGPGVHGRTARRTAGAGGQGSPHLPRFLSSGFETQRPPPPPTLASSCPKQLQATGRQPPPPLPLRPFSLPLSSLQGNKGLFIKTELSGRRGGMVGESTKDNKRLGGDEAERPPGASGPWRQGSPSPGSGRPPTPVRDHSGGGPAPAEG